MEYMECEVPPTEGYCSDNDCRCAPEKIARGQGYLYISRDVVEFRKDALARPALQAKLAPQLERGDYVSPTTYEPILVCEQSAQTRGLDKKVASDDARQWWETSRAPLRPTPLIDWAEGAACPQSPVAANLTTEPASKETVITQSSEMVSVSNGNQHDRATPEQVTYDMVRDFAPTASIPVEAPAPQNGPRDWAVSDLPPTSATGKTITSQIKSGAIADLKASMEPDSSNEEIAAKFAGGPLAEFASRMARDTMTGSKPQAETEEDPFATKIRQKTQIVKTPVKPNQRPGIPRQKKGIGSLAIAAIIIGFIIVIGVGTAALVIVVGKPKPLPVTQEVRQQPPLDPDRPTDGTVDESQEFVIPGSSEASTENGEVASAPAASRAVSQQKPSTVPPPNARATSGSKPLGLNERFFSGTYTFRDSKYRGSIKFLAAIANEGTYEQTVKLPGKDKDYFVKGTFVHTTDKIVFSPSGATTDITWSLESWDQQNNSAVFFDPKQSNRMLARIYLTR